MADVRCPECKLMLASDEPEPARRIWCPGCGILFQVDRANGTVTVFYEEEPEASEAEDISNAQAGAEAVDPVAEDLEGTPGYVDLAAYEQLAVQANREARVRWQLYCTVLFISLGLAFGLFRTITNRDGDWQDILLRTLWGAPLVGLVLGLVIPGMIFSNARIVKPERPDFKEIADRLNEPPICRRPLPPPDSDAPPETEPCNNPNTTSNSDDPHVRE